MTFETWLYHMWCTLVLIALGVPKLTEGFGKVGGAQLSYNKANR